MTYGYIRVSTDKQTTENQRFEIENYCSTHKLKIDKWINETISGKMDLNERELGKLLSKIKKNDIIICSELSRLSRDMYSLIAILGACQNQGVKVVMIKENLDPQKDRYAKYLVPVLAVYSEIERDLISQRTKESLAFRKAAGIKLGRPFGSKSKVKKLTGKESLIKKMLSEKISQRKMAKMLKVHKKTLKSFIEENGFCVK